MRLLVNVDQTSALRAGIDAPHSTTQIEVDPSSLNQDQRYWIADHLRDGYSLTSSHLAVTEPSLDGLLVAIDACLAADRAEELEKVARRQKADAKIQEILNAPLSSREDQVYLTGDKVKRGYGCQASCQVTVPELAYCNTLSASPEMVEAYRARKAEVEQMARECYDAVRPRLVADRDKRDAARAQMEAARKAGYDALYARLPETMRKRHADGYAGEEEIRDAIRGLMRADAGYADLGEVEYDSREDSTLLTDEQYASLLGVKQKAPQGATIETQRIFAVADTYEGDYEEDNDSVPIGMIARVQWTRGGITASVEIVL